MTIKTQLQEQMKMAMREKNKLALTTIRMMIDRIQKKEKELLRDLSEEEVVAVLQTFKKQVEEEMEAFLSIGNSDKFSELYSSSHLIQTFLPRMMSADEIKRLVVQAFADLASGGQKINKGSVMKALMPLVKGKADNKLVNEIVTEAFMTVV